MLVYLCNKLITVVAITTNNNVMLNDIGSFRNNIIIVGYTGSRKFAKD